MRPSSTGCWSSRSCPPTSARDASGLPGRWLAIMRASIDAAIWRFSTARMLTEYVDRLYLPVARTAELAAAR